MIDHDSAGGDDSLATTGHPCGSADPTGRRIAGSAADTEARDSPTPDDRSTSDRRVEGESHVRRSSSMSTNAPAMQVADHHPLDYRHMMHALELARRGLYSSDPNPRVGCVIAHGERIVGEGWHRYAGEPHAEIHALAAAGGEAAGATAYVTLEPCRHTGRTGPCTRALVEAGIERVVAAMRDPNPRVAGRGFADLVAAGIEVETGLLQAEAQALNRGFVSRFERGRPWIRCKLAATLDGRTATATGESRWITGDGARADVHRLRAQSSAVLTGIGTLLADDPRLDARVEDADCLAPPMRVIVDSRLRTPSGARVFSAPGRVVIATSRNASPAPPLLDTGAEVVPLPDTGGRVALDALMTTLAEDGVNEVHTECGPTLAGALLESGLVDELVVYLAPALLGDAARGMFTLPMVAEMRDRIGLEITGVTRVGADLRVDAVPCVGSRAVSRE